MSVIKDIRWPLVVGALPLAAAFGWAFWPTLVAMVDVWQREPDYSHGFLVLPVALSFLAMRWDKRPALSLGLHWGGLLLIGVSFLVRLVGARFYIDALDGWAMPMWVGGAVWALLGRAVFLWAAPAIGFLWFMVPLPYRVEHMLSQPLQAVAGMLSCWLLQSMGQPALLEGNVITLGDHQLEVAQACSGLRMFMSFVALGVAYALFVERPLWQKVTMFLAILPIALLSNAIRIAATGMLFQYASGETARWFAHDAAGWAMIPLAVALLAMLMWYLGHLVVEVESLPPQELVRRQQAT